MARLTRHQSAARARLVEIAELGETAECAATGIGEALGRAIGWDGFRLFGVEAQTRLINRVLAASEHDHPFREEWLRDVYLRAGDHGLGFIELGYLHQARLPVVTFQGRLDDCFGFPPETLRVYSDSEFRDNFQRNHAPVGGTVLANFESGGQWIASLQAYRRDVRVPFRVSDVAFVRSVSGLIADILASALSREAALLAVADHPSDSAGILVLERTGRVRFVTPAGEAWLRALRVPPGEAQTKLPSALWGTMAGLGDRQPRVVNSVRVPGGSATIEATPGGPDGSVAVIITPRQAGPEIIPPANWALTAAESRVAALVVQGLGNRAIADRLSISPNTVEWHLRHVFDRMSVRSRAQLTARYFQDTSLPELTKDRTIVGSAREVTREKSTRPSRRTT